MFEPITHWPVNFGVVGCGMIGKMTATALDGPSGARLTAVADVEAGSASALAAAHPGSRAVSTEALLASDDVDVVCVCVPSGSHAEIGVAALEAGKHVVVEKPLEVSLDAARKLVDTARSTGRLLSVISQHRFDPGVVEAHSLVASGRLGRILTAAARVPWYRSQAYYDSADWRGTWALDGGGALMNQAIHYADLLRWIAGDVEEVVAWTASTDRRIEVEDVAVALVRFRGGGLATLHASTVSFPGLPEWLEVSGTGGTVRVEQGRLVVRELVGERPDVGPSGGRVRDVSAPLGVPAPAMPDGHRNQLADVVAALTEGRQPSVTGSDGYRSLELVLAVYRSATTGLPVRLPLD